MTAIDLTTLDRQVAAASALLASIRPHLPDVHGIAYERAVAGERVGGKSHVEGYAHTTTGDNRAKEALRQIEHAVLEVGRAVNACRNVYADGCLDETLRGSLVGVVGLGQALKAQARRRARGEYSPVRLEPQPEVKAPKSKKAKRKGRR